MTRRRLQYGYSVGVPLEQADQQFHLFSVEGEPTIIDQVQIRVAIEGGVPRLALSRPVFTRSYTGKRIEARSVPFFSAPQKMDAPSFSLPAGPPILGGTCAAARLVPGRGILAEGGRSVCAECYALTGHYPQHGVAFGQAVRLRWLLDQLTADPSGQVFVDAFSGALHAFASNPARGRLERRFSQELGVWRKGEVVVRTRHGWATAQHADLPAPWSSSTEAIADLHPTEGQVTGYFRWHDSGDVNVGRDPELWQRYVRAIGAIGRAFPAVWFWLPTRTSFIPFMHELLAEETARTPNLTIRSSALRINCDPPPVEAGLPAGTTVLETPHPPRMEIDALGRVARQCPAYSGGKSSTCLSEGCRACWLARDTPVWYPLHKPGG